MSQLINSNDVTADLETSDRAGPFPTDLDSSSRIEDNQISMNVEEVNVSHQTDNNIKLVLSVYGNDLRVKYPTKMGNVYSFIFVNGQPLIILGPQCK